MKKLIVILLLLTVSGAQAQKNQKAVALADKLYMLWSLMKIKAHYF